MPLLPIVLERRSWWRAERVRANALLPPLRLRQRGVRRCAAGAGGRRATCVRGDYATAGAYRQWLLYLCRLREGSLYYFLATFR